MKYRSSILVVLAFSFFLYAPALSHASVISGIKEYNYPCWDFSDTTGVELDDPDADIVIFITLEEQAKIISAASFIGGRNGALVAWLPDSTFEDLKYAPPDISPLYMQTVCFLLYDSYVVKTVEGHYAKFRFLPPRPLEDVWIEYVYQPNGSRELFDPVGVENYTWGAIKNIFR